MSGYRSLTENTALRGCFSAQGCISLPGYFSVQIISYRAGIILLDYFYHNGTVRLFRLLNDPVLSVVLVQSFFVLRNFLLYQRDGVVVYDVLLQYKVESLADTCCFYPFHLVTSLSEK